MGYRNLALMLVFLTAAAWAIIKFYGPHESSGPSSVGGASESGSNVDGNGKNSQDTTTDASAGNAAEPTPSLSPQTRAEQMPPADDLHVKLQQKDIIIGSGKQAAEGRRVQIHVIMKLKDGKIVFDTYKQGQPWDGVVGDGRFIKGLDQGIRGMFQGGKRALWIPSYLAFGTFGISPQIPPNSKVYAEVELVSVF